MRPVLIYALSESVTAPVRYVGMCFADRAKTRLWAHRNHAVKGIEQTDKAKWVASVVAAGGEIVMRRLEVCEFGQRAEREIFWIAKFKSSGLLTNMADGGKGCPGYKWSDEARRGISRRLKGRPKSEAHRANLAKSRIGMRPTDEVRAKMSAAHMGRRQSPEAIAKTAAAHRGKIRTAEARKKQSESRKRSILARLEAGWIPSNDVLSSWRRKSRQDMLSEYARRVKQF